VLTARGVISSPPSEGSPSNQFCTAASTLVAAPSGEWPPRTRASSGCSCGAPGQLPSGPTVLRHEAAGEASGVPSSAE